MLDTLPEWIRHASPVIRAASALIDEAQLDRLRSLEPVVRSLTVPAAMIGGLWALLLYHRGKRREAAQWMHDIFQRFQLGAEFDRAKLIFDFEYRETVEPIHAALVAGGNVALDAAKRADSQHLDRLLNYLEHLAYLTDYRHVRRSDCAAYFKYWFDLLGEPERGALRRYLVRFGYERLARVARAGSDDYLLLYGSLGSREPMHAELGLDKALEKVGEREVPGSQYDLGEFPGLVLGAGIVRAELFKVRDLSVLLRLDQYEEFDHADAAQSLFRRTTLRLPLHRSPLIDRLRGNPMIDAWIYVYNRPVEGSEKIDARSWREHKLDRQSPEFPPG